MKNIIFLYKTILKKNFFYSRYLRSFLIFISENVNEMVNINLNIRKIINNIKNINKQYKINYLNNNDFLNNIYIINGFKILFSENLAKITIKKCIWFKDFLKYKIFNNLNFFTILNNLFNNTKINILLENKIKNITIINIFDDKNEQKLITYKKNLIIKSNINIKDVFLIKSNNNFVNSETFLCIKKKNKINYKIISNNQKSTLAISFYTILKQQASIKFYDFLNDKSNYYINYSFFLNEKKSSVKNNLIKLSNTNKFDKRILNIYHFSEKTYSKTFFKAILDNKSILNFSGNIIVGLNTKGIKSNLDCYGLLLSNKTSLEFNPNMFINTKEIKCTHGANIGNISNDEIYYMKSRGLKENKSKKIIKKSIIKKYKNIIKIKNLGLDTILYE